MKQQYSKLNKIISYLKNNSKKRNIVLSGVAVCLLIAVCTSTYSYFSAKDKIVNELDVSKLSFEIEEPNWEEPDTPVKPGDVLPKDPQIVNTGEISFVTRVRIEEVWTPKDTTDTTLNTMTNKDYVRYLAKMPQPTNQELLEILKTDQALSEEQKSFALRLNLNAEGNGWYRGNGEPGKKSEWLYYDKIVNIGGRTNPVFNAVTIRTAEDFNKLADTAVSQAAVLSEVEAKNAKITDDVQNSTDTLAISNVVEETPQEETLDMPTVLTDVIVDTYQTNIEDYNAMLAKYNLQIYVYAETVQANSFAWNDAWGADIPEACKTNWDNGITTNETTEGSGDSSTTEATEPSTQSEEPNTTEQTGSTTEPSTTQQSATQQSITEPSTTQQSTTQQSTTEPNTTQQSTTQQSTTEPSTTQQSTTQQNSTQQSNTTGVTVQGGAAQ
ncbi:hypothetical protein B5E58_11275 [Tyzzerella sp. An114]|uniref:hypothetical protein n=1 Tax=Tyzzerella sp. An114 TaxID=1965545 RepID=UPI000B441233|nr:hypothetical protein [Tyzzerella sp. An114]OUQ56111.1 hypothetical protein B5E58_11275 [Tyzzerella sp. An114]